MSASILYAVIPVLNRWDQTRRCLERLIGGQRSPTRIIVVDHGSTDGTRSGLAADFPQVIRLEDDPAHWWAGAINTGIREALKHDADRIILLNNDCYVETDTLAKLLQHAERHPGAVIAPVQRHFEDGAVSVVRANSCFLAGYPTLVFPWYSRHVGEKRLLRTGLVIGGRGALIPRTVFDTVGLFDNAHLPHYGADHDFYLRCRKQGVPLYVAADAAVKLDSSHTTLATHLGRLTLREFRETLTQRRSHRNLHDLATLFRMHYPIPGLWWAGAGLNLARYVLVFFVARGLHLIAAREK